MSEQNMTIEELAADFGVPVEDIQRRKALEDPADVISSQSDISEFRRITKAE